MGHFEMFRAAFVSNVMNVISDESLQAVIKALDIVSNDYEITRKTTDIIVSDGIPEVVRLFIAAKAVEHIAKSTLGKYLEILTGFFKMVCKPVTDITTNDVRVYLFRYEEERHIAKETLNLHRSVLNSFFEWLAGEEYIPKNPVKKIKTIHCNGKKMPTMEALELEIMRSACRTERERALVDFLYSTGARISEVRNAMIDDIDFANHTFTIRHGKGDKERITYLNAKCELSLRTYLDSRDDNSPYLFVTMRYPHRQITTNRAMENEVDRIRSRTSLKKKITPHAFRRTTATIGTSNGMPVQEMQKMLGHADINTTMRYVTINQESVRISHSKYIA